MKKKLTLRIPFPAIIASMFALCCLTSCEKHEDVYYFKSTCTAELNGHTYIDQTPFDHAFSPEAPKTPSFDYGEYSATFYTHLSENRQDSPLYFVEINLFVNTPEEFLSKAQSIEKIDIEYSQSLPNALEYALYCGNHKVSYATVNAEIVDNGTFQITSADKTKHRYTGTFTLPFSEGTLKGTFEIE